MNHRFELPAAQLPLLQHSLLQHSSLQHFQTLELRTPFHLADRPPFSIELTSRTRRLQSIALAFLVLVLLAISTTTSYQLWQYNSGVTDENGLLELAQGGLLILAASVQTGRALITPRPALQRNIRIGLAFFAFALFLREVDIDHLGRGHLWNWLETGLRLIALIGIFGFIVHMLRRTKMLLRNLKRILLAPAVVISLLACAFYACGWPFDKELFNIDTDLSVWFEETLELNACLLFLIAGFTNSIKSIVVSLKVPSF